VSCIALALPTPSGESILLSASMEDDEGYRESRGRRTCSRYGRAFKGNLLAPRVQGGLYDDGINILGTLPPIESEYQCSGVRSEGSGQPKRVPTR
jgi:hypothetical protein